jgi:hypothetical protein
MKSVGVPSTSPDSKCETDLSLHASLDASDLAESETRVGALVVAVLEDHRGRLGPADMVDPRLERGYDRAPCWVHLSLAHGTRALGSCSTA